jgi:hypothetical protein
VVHGPVIAKKWHGVTVTLFQDNFKFCDGEKLGNYFSPARTRTFQLRYRNAKHASRILNLLTDLE